MWICCFTLLGGKADSAEKLVRMVRSKVGAAALRIIVPDFAKSAGTLMVLGADSVVMSDMSELGAHRSADAALRLLAVSPELP